MNPFTRLWIHSQVESIHKIVNSFTRLWIHSQVESIHKKCESIHKLLWIDSISCESNHTCKSSLNLFKITCESIQWGVNRFTHENEARIYSTLAMNRFKHWRTSVNRFNDVVNRFNTQENGSDLLWIYSHLLVNRFTHN